MQNNEIEDWNILSDMEESNEPIQPLIVEKAEKVQKVEKAEKVQKVKKAEKVIKIEKDENIENIEKDKDELKNQILLNIQLTRIVLENQKDYLEEMKKQKKISKDLFRKLTIFQQRQEERDCQCTIL